MFIVDSVASMHMLSKRDLSSDVQIDEEAQVFVHDLDLFVTVQLLDETPAILSLHKLCPKRGYSSEWRIGETPRLTKNGRTITCTMDNLVPLVVPGLSSFSSSIFSSTSRSTDQSNYSRKWRTPSDPVTARSDNHACGKQMLTDPDKQATRNREPAYKKFLDETDKGDPTQGSLDWLQPFTDNLEDLETHVPAHSSVRENSDSEGDASKVERQKRKHSIYTHFAKDRNCDVCWRTEITRVPCRRRYARSIPGAEHFGDLITAEHKVLKEGSGSRNNHRFAVVVQDLATQWNPCETKTSQETEKNLGKFLEPSQKPKVSYTNDSLEFGKSCEELSWNHRTATLCRSETSGIAERAARRAKEGTSAVLLQSRSDDTIAAKR